MKIRIILFAVVSLFLCGCSVSDQDSISLENDIEKTEVIEISSLETIEKNTEEDDTDYTDQSGSDSVDTNDKQIKEPEILNFVDVYGEEYQVEINPDIPKHSYDKGSFIHHGDKLSYNGDDKYSFRLGVDVSHHQGAIDWEKVKADGYDFCFLRIGYRGYGSEGKIREDREFERNILNAQKAGLDVGVYFFAQAINEEEAIEEAKFVLEHLDGKELQLPVVYDPESILDDVARTDDVSGEQFTRNTLAFCKIISDAGYEPAIYSNMLWEAYEFDLSKLEGIPIWYADYEEYPQTPYHFQYWQYTNEASVSGIDGVCDTDIELIRN